MQAKKTKKEKKPARERVVDKETIALASQIVKKEKKTFTTEQVVDLKKAWKKMKKTEAKFLKDVAKIEKDLQEKTKIKDVEFFWLGADCHGIGNVSKTMVLVASYDLEEKVKKTGDNK